MSDNEWTIGDRAVKKLRESPLLQATISGGGSLPVAARISDEVIIHFASNTTYTLGYHQLGSERLYGVQVYSGVYANLITGDHARTLWVGLCMVSADWRKLAEHIETPKIASTDVPKA
jgi:hypothetical protein